MFLKAICKQKWALYTPCDENGMSDLYTFFENIEERYQPDAYGLLAKIEKISDDEKGPKIFNKRICHFVDDTERIFQVRHGHLRLLMFYSPEERKVIICSSPFIKSTNKTPRSEIQKAIDIKERYLSSVQQKQIVIIPDDEEATS